MDKYNVSDFKKNDKLLKSKLKDSKESILVNETLYVYYPKRFEDIHIATIATNVKMVSIFILADAKNNYAFINIPLIVDINPSSIEDVMVGDALYTKLTLNKNDALISNKKVIKDGSFIFTLYDEFIVKGKVPFYMEYESLVDLFLSSGKFNGAKIGDNPSGIEAMVSVIARDKKDLNKFIRTSSLDLNKLTNTDIAFIGLTDVNHGLSTNIAKLTGAYLNDGITSILVNDNLIETEIEKYYRM